MVERLKPTIILLDLLLPKIDGFEILRVVKADPALKNIPVIVLSNLGDETDIKKAKDLGAQDYFVKADTKLEILSEKVKKVIASLQNK